MTNYKYKEKIRLEFRSMRIRSIFISAVLSLVVMGCGKYGEGSIPPGHGSSVIEDRERYIAVPSMIISYVDYPIYDIRLLLSLEPKTAFRDAIVLPSVFPDEGINVKGLKRISDGGSGDIAWDRTWPVTKKYRVWWHRVVDPVAFAAASNYDRYTNRASEPGTAWCEAIVVLDKALPPMPGHFVLSFYPSGRVEADISAKKYDPSKDPTYELLDNVEDLIDPNDKPLEFDELGAKACIKEINNPYFGEKRPIKMD